MTAAWGSPDATGPRGPTGGGARSVLGRPAREGTRWRVRLVAVVAYAVFLWAWFGFAHAVGLPENPLTVSVLIWIATIAWTVETPARRQLDFLRDWWPAMVGLTVYWFTRAYTDDLGIPVHVTMPVRFDEWFAGLFGGSGHEVPTEILQRHWCALPCDSTVPIHWYDVVLTTVYSTHFFTGLAIAGVLWVVRRGEFGFFMRRYLAINYAALVVYFLYPMAPPWLAAQEGALPDVIRRSSGRGWGHQVAAHVDATLTGLSNPTAAMPSLHTGVATTIAIYGIWRLHSRWRFLLALYPLTMATALVYFAEHYVIDVIAGAGLAGLMAVLVRLYERRRGLIPGFEPPRRTGARAMSSGSRTTVM